MASTISTFVMVSLLLYLESFTPLLQNHQPLRSSKACQILAAHLVSLHRITTTGLIALTLPERFPSIGELPFHDIDSPLRPSWSDHSPGTGFGKKCPSSPQG